MWLTALILLYMPQDMSFNSYEKQAQEMFYRYYFDPSRDNPNIDVLNYDLNFEFQGVETTVGNGDARLTIAIINPDISEISLDFRNECTVDQVLVNDESTSFTHGTTKLSINLPANPGDTILVRIIYRIPQLSRGIVAENASVQGPGYSMVLFSFTEPIDSRYYFPCVDSPDDKALLRMSVTVPKQYKVAGNGNLVEDNIKDNKRTSVWIESYPVSTYLIAFGVANYAVVRDTTDYGVPMRHYVYQPDSLKGVLHFKKTNEMVDRFSDMFGPYPFEAYGHMQAPIGGGMEHQTMTTYLDLCVTAEYGCFDLIAHELAHMWWGDMVTLGTWADIWINEGFASYGNALMQEAINGKTALDQAMSGSAQQYMSEDGRNRFPIYNPPYGYLFSSTVYEKGSWILHMLRYYIGDDAFFNGMKAYGAKYKYGNAVTTDFIASMEAASEMDLTNFFDEWVYQAGYPVYEIGYVFRGDRVRGVVRQVQDNAPLFTIPIELLIRGDRGKEKLVKIYPTDWEQEFTVITDFAPNELVFDPDNWILKDYYEDYFDVDNPVNETLIKYSRNTIEAFADAQLSVYNINGALIHDKKLAEGDKYLLPASIPNGIYFIIANDKHKAQTLKILNYK